jgi:hypothetical protein
MNLSKKIENSRIHAADEDREYFKEFKSPAGREDTLTFVSNRFCMALNGSKFKG